MAALTQWPEQGLPDSPGGWLAAVARRKAIDAVRREAARGGKEMAAASEWRREQDAAAAQPTPLLEDQLCLIFTCCHPALDISSRIGLTLRVVCGIPAASIAALLLVPEPTLAQRLVRARRKIRDAGIALRMPTEQERPARLAAVLRVVYLTFTEGHYARTGAALIRDDLCAEALWLARALHDLLPADPETAGLLALILLTDARRATRTSPTGEIVLLEDQDRTGWDTSKIGEGLNLVERTLTQGRPGPYQLQAAIAACHAEASTYDRTDWRQIAALYSELLRLDPSPLIEANRAVAVAMVEGPAAGLAVLDTLVASPALARWPQLHTARAGLMARLGRRDDAIAAYRDALVLEPPEAERRFICARITDLTDTDTDTDDER